MSNQPVNPAQEQQALLLRQAQNRQALVTAGTVLVSTAGTIYFDLNGKNLDRLNALRDLADDVARFTNGRVSEGDIHPLTNSPATLVIQIADVRSDAAQSIFKSLAGTGNAYTFKPDRPASTFLRFNDIQNAHELRAFADRCYKLVPNPAGGALREPERTLLGIVKNAAALSAVKVSQGMTDKLYIPGSLYDRDPVKACVLEAFLQSTAENNRAASAKENFVNQGDNKYMVAHSLTGDFAVQDVMIALSHSDYMFSDEFKNSVILDMELYSSVAKVDIRPPQSQQSGRDILQELGIGADIEAFGVKLGTYTPPKVN